MSCHDFLDLESSEPGGVEFPSMSESSKGDEIQVNRTNSILVSSMPPLPTKKGDVLE